MTQRYSLWLLPEPQTAEVINAVIGRLSIRFNTPGFTTHTTLCSGLWSGDISPLVAVVDAIGRQSKTLTTASTGIRYTDSRFQFFYLSLAVEGLRDLRDLAQQGLPGSRLPEVGPHLSMIYSDNFHGIDRKQLTEELQSQMPSMVGFDRLALVLPRDNNWDDIADWNITHSTSLA